MPEPTIPLLNHLFTESGDPDYAFGSYTKFESPSTGGGQSGSWIGGTRPSSPSTHDLCAISPVFTASGRVQFSFELYYDGIGSYPIGAPRRRLITFFGTNGASRVQILSVEALDRYDNDQAHITARAFTAGSDNFLYDGSGSTTYGSAVSAWDESANFPGAVSPYNVKYTISGDISFHEFGHIKVWVDGSLKLDTPMKTSWQGYECTAVGFSGGRRTSNALTFNTTTLIKNLTVDQVLEPSGNMFSVLGGLPLLGAPTAPASILDAGDDELTPPTAPEASVASGSVVLIPPEGAVVSIVPSAVSYLNDGGVEIGTLAGSVDYSGTDVTGALLVPVASGPTLFSVTSAEVAPLAGNLSLPASGALLSLAAEAGRIDQFDFGPTTVTATAGEPEWHTGSADVVAVAGTASVEAIGGQFSLTVSAAQILNSGVSFTLESGSMSLVGTAEPSGAQVVLTAGVIHNSDFIVEGAYLPLVVRRLPHPDSPLFVKIASGAVIGHSATGAVTLLEETSSRYMAQFVDESGVNVPGSVFDTFMITGYTKLSTIRPTETALNQNDVTLSATGGIAWNIKPFDTEIVTEGLSIGRDEEHFALWEWTYGAEAIDAIDDPFATVSGSKLVTVTHASHGLVPDNHVVIFGSSPVGGLHFEGLLIVDSVVDTDTYKLRHKSAATSTATGGGSCLIHVNPTAGKGEFKFRVKRVDAI